MKFNVPNSLASRMVGQQEQETEYLHPFPRTGSREMEQEVGEATDPRSPTPVMYFSWAKHPITSLNNTTSWGPSATRDPMRTFLMQSTIIPHHCNCVFSFWPLDMIRDCPGAPAAPSSQHPAPSASWQAEAAVKTDKIHHQVEARTHTIKYSDPQNNL